MFQEGYGYPKRTQVLLIDNLSAAITNPVGAHIHCVRLLSTTACHIKFAKTPVAVATDFYLPANKSDYFVIHPGQKVAGIQNASSGTLYVTEMTR